MSESRETDLWAWLLFAAGIKTYQAKQLLLLLSEKSLSLDVLIKTPANERASMGFGVYTDILSQPTILPEIPPAIRWDEPLYPQGLQELSLKEKPALLFYKGAADFLSRPIIFLEPGELSGASRELLIGVIEILLDGSLLPAVFSQSPQEEVLLELMSYSDGEALIFLDQGFEQWQPTDAVAQHVHTGRVVILSPMPPAAKSSPVATAIIKRIASTAAARWIFSSNQPGRRTQTEVRRPLLQLNVDGQAELLQGSESMLAADISDVINWLQDSPATHANYSEVQNETLINEALARQEESLPPINTEKALEILEMGGSVPDALRQRLMRNQADTE